jgi:hypothetical protein
MVHGNNKNMISFNAIDQAIVALNEFSVSIGIVLEEISSEKWLIFKDFYTIDKLLGKSLKH